MTQTILQALDGAIEHRQQDRDGTGDLRLRQNMSYVLAGLKDAREIVRQALTSVGHLPTANQIEGQRYEQNPLPDRVEWRPSLDQVKNILSMYHEYGEEYPMFRWNTETQNLINSLRAEEERLSNLPIPKEG